MSDKINITRRDLSKKIGFGLGACWLTPGIALAGMATPSQVEGPFYPDSPQDDTDLDLCMIKGHNQVATGEQILVHGRVINTRGEALVNATVDVWQANHFGRYRHTGDKNTAPLDPNFQGWGVMHTDVLGQYHFKTIKPGAYPLSFFGEPGQRCRHIHFKISHPQYSTLTTQMYFYGDPLIEQDLEIATVPKEQQHLLIARAQPDEETGLPRYQFDVCVGEGPA